MGSIIVPCPLAVRGNYDLGYLLAQGFILQNTGSIEINVGTLVSHEGQ